MYPYAFVNDAELLNAAITIIITIITGEDVRPIEQVDKQPYVQAQLIVGIYT